MTGSLRCLAIFHKQIGDLVLLEPALARLAQASARPVDLITRSGFEPLVSLMPAANFRSKPSLRLYDRLWCFDDRRKSAFFSFISRARQKCLLINPGAAVSWYHQRVFPKILAPDPGDSHVAEYYWRHTDVGEAPHFRPPQLSAPPGEWEFPLSSKNYLCVNPTAGWKSKNWTPEKWARTINCLNESGIRPTVMTSGNQDWQQEHCYSICRLLKCPIENVAGLTTLKNYLSILLNARLVLTVDGSASHIAAAFQRKCVTLFGHTDPAHWHWPSEYSRAILASKFTGAPDARLALLPEEPVVETVMKLWQM
jgi:ADP-heptose:LPS heptosyltransferase